MEAVAMSHEPFNAAAAAVLTTPVLVYYVIGTVLHEISHAAVFRLFGYSPKIQYSDTGMWPFPTAGRCYVTPRVSASEWRIACISPLLFALPISTAMWGLLARTLPNASVFHATMSIAVLLLYGPSASDWQSAIYGPDATNSHTPVNHIVAEGFLPTILAEGDVPN